MVKERQKALRYRRALFNRPRGQPAPRTLEFYLEEAHGKFKTVATRRVELDGNFVIEVRHQQRRRGVGLLLHVTAYTREEPASVVPQVTARDDEAPISTTPPPNGTDFMDGDLHILVAGDDVIMCASGIRERKFEEYCSIIFDRAEFPPVAGMFHLEAVANANKLKVIEDEGVKEIKLDAVSYVATGQQLKRYSLRRTLRDEMLDTLRALFGDDPGVQDVADAENLSAQIVLKFDRRKKGGELSAERMSGLAKRLVDEGDEGFTIRTMGNTTLGYNQISLQRPAKIAAYGKTVQRDAAFRELVSYYTDLKNEGHLEE